ncbi:MAG: hypothetical protein FJ387_23605 [Verrucomicrobia bacterium]|nr:hypothetical protein [Verrucomicrobiota bacterium]
MNPTRRTTLFMTLLALCLSASLARAEVRVAKIFSDHMVLQRDRPAPVWGWATPGDAVTVAFAGQSKRATADAQGRWRVTLDSLPANSTGRELTVAAEGATPQRVTIQDVLVGEVWFTAGQSNMMMGLAGATGGAAAYFPSNPCFTRASRLCSGLWSGIKFPITGQCQLPSGAWTDTLPSQGWSWAKNLDKETGLYAPWPGFDAHWPLEYDPSTVLHFLGRVRKELKTDEFKPIEDKAYAFQVKNTLRRFDWRKQGPSESRRNQHPWPTMPENALHFANYLALDLPDRPLDWNLMSDLCRWSEDRAVDWTRPGEPGGLPGQNAMGLNPSVCGEGTLTPRLALAYARLAEHTKNPLHRAKAEALAGTVLAAQNPVTGQITPSLSTDPKALGQGSGDGGGRGEFIALALWQLSQMWEGKK